ncbi:MAG TPA: ABC transporter permease [Bryobacteraceae bacterium]|jgi:ABC-type polysaccharide/polyol phosphate export permease
MPDLFNDTIRAMRAWRVWMFLGVQDVKTRFRRSALGPIWIVLNMAFFVVGAGLLYGVMIKQPMKILLPYLVCGFTIWGSIMASLTESGWAFVGAEGYIKQFCYPKQIYLMRNFIYNFVILFVTLCALIPVQLFFGTFYITGWLLSIPGFLLLAIAILGHITISAYLSVRFRDLPHAAGGILQVAFFVTPVMFPISMLKERRFDWIYQFNPFYYLLEVVRYPLLQGKVPGLEVYMGTGIYIVFLWVMAYLIARSLDSRVVLLL